MPQSHDFHPTKPTEEPLPIPTDGMDLHLRNEPCVYVVVGVVLLDSWQGVRLQSNCLKKVRSVSLSVLEDLPRRLRSVSLIVGIENVPYWFTIDDVRDLVAPHGSIESIVIRPGPSRHAPLTAVVMLATREDAERTVEALNGAECLGYMLQVEMSAS